MKFSRRNMIVAATAFAATSSSAARAIATAIPERPRAPSLVLPRPGSVAPVAPAALPVPRGPYQPETVAAPLFDAAMAALNRHGGRVKGDRIGIVDFSASSSQPRLHLVDLENRKVTSLHVAHGSGSDPAHTGWLQRFSNRPGSNASSEGAFLTSDYYFGAHGRSQRLVGLDPTNSNALERAIVVHGAWYAEPNMIGAHGKLGRSQGCLAVGDSLLNRAFDHLGEGRLIYAAKLG
ncbi:MAG: murein L,D-transpeptidase catalytic domain family protein [Novosphingobium sp.]|nr:murein L,D-transpeptidase catalytic domain family protein [Novosphingobium sp.]